MSLGDDHLGDLSNLRKYPRGDRGRSRPPLNSGRLYDYVITTPAIVFYEHGKCGELGNDIGLLKHIIGYLGLKLECTHSVDIDYYEKQDKKSRAAGQAQPGFFMSNVAQEYQMSFEYVQELFTRDYLYRDEIDPRWGLSGLAGNSILIECLPGVVKREYGKSDAAFSALEMLLRALPGSVYEANLLEFMFEHNEANGNKDVRNRWSQLWR